MFSITTMASSTTKPVAMVSAIRDRLSRLKPHRYMAASVPTIESGTESAGMMVARQSRRNTKMTSTTRKAASTSSNSTSATEARMVSVRSLTVRSCTLAGSPACSVGSRFLMDWATAMTLAPG